MAWAPPSMTSNLETRSFLPEFMDARDIVSRNGEECNTVGLLIIRKGMPGRPRVALLRL